VVTSGATAAHVDDGGENTDDLVGDVDFEMEDRELMLEDGMLTGGVAALINFMNLCLALIAVVFATAATGRSG
jgi:hypothetical protein